VLGTDWREDVVIVVVVTIGVGAVFTVFTDLDAQARFVATQPVDYVSPADTDIGFTRGQLDNLQFVSQNSLAGQPGDERLYCFSVRNGNVRDFRVAGSIEESTRTSVAGRCFGRVDGVIHSQPDRSSGLSEEDTDTESDLRFSCIHYAEIAVSPTGSVDGLRCWQVDGIGTSAEFTEVEVGVR